MLPAALPPGLAHVRDLEAFGGPILAEFTDTAGGTWVAKWATVNENAHRWLIMRSTASSIESYLAGAITMEALLRAEGDAAMLVDFDGPEARGAWEVSLDDDAVACYLPESHVMHDPSLRPEDGRGMVAAGWSPGGVEFAIKEWGFGPTIDENGWALPRGDT
jgi:hypothetical protein